MGTLGEGFKRQVIGAFDGSWNVPYPKSARASAYGTFAGTTYAFHSDSAGNNVAQCASFDFKFIDSSSFGYYCRFYSAAQSRPFVSGTEWMTTASSVFYAKASEIHYLPSPPPSPPPPSPPPPSPPPPSPRRRPRRRRRRARAAELAAVAAAVAAAQAAAAGAAAAESAAAVAPAEPAAEPAAVAAAAVAARLAVARAPSPPAAPPPAAQFRGFGAINEDQMISSNAISSHATDTAALAACVNAGELLLHRPRRAELDASVRWSARLGGAGVEALLACRNVDSWVYSGSCRRRLAEEWADESTTVAEDPEPEAPWAFRWSQWVGIPDMDEHPVVKLKPARGPLLRQNAHLRI